MLFYLLHGVLETQRDNFAGVFRDVRRTTDLSSADEVGDNVSGVFCARSDPGRNLSPDIGGKFDAPQSR